MSTTATPPTIGTTRDFIMTWGIEFVSYTLDTALWGIAFVLVLQYFRKYGRTDPISIRFVVGILGFFSTIHSIFLAMMNYKDFITLFGDAVGQNEIFYEADVMVCAIYIVTFTAQIFYASRIFILSKHNWKLVAPVVLFALLQFSAGIAQTVMVAKVHLYSGLQAATIPISTTQSSGSLACDITITAILCTILRRSRTGLRRTDSTLDRMIIYAFNRGALTSLFALLQLICFVGMPGNFVFMLFIVPSLHLYVISVCSMLMARESLRDDLAGPNGFLSTFSVHDGNQHIALTNVSSNGGAATVNVSTSVVRWVDDDIPGGTNKTTLQQDAVSAANSMSPPPFLLEAPAQAPCPHGTSVSCTFRPPPLDGSRGSIPELFEWHAENNPGHPLFVYATEDGTKHVNYNTFKQAFHRAGTYVSAFDQLDNPPTIVSVLATSDTITTFTTIMGMVRAGIVVFPLSPRFSPEVLGYLLASNSVQYVLVSTELHIRNLAGAAIANARTRNPSQAAPQIHEMPTFEMLYGEKALSSQIPPRIKIELVANQFCNSFDLRIPPSRSMDFTAYSAKCHGCSKQPLCHEIFGCQGLELFHTLGLLFMLFSSTCGYTLATFEPKTPATIQTPEAVFKGYRAANVNYALANPRFIQEWSRDKAKIEFLSTLKGVMFGGKLLSGPAGDELTAAGVKLLPTYGSTEGGQISVMIPEYSAVKGWEYFEINPQCAHVFVPVGDGSYKLLLLATPTQDLSCVNDTIHSQGAYNTGDLLVHHLSDENLWRVLGRGDDHIMLATGEVIHPVHLENILSSDPAILAAVIFGHARTKCGVLIELAPKYEFDHDDPGALVEFRDSIWPLVEKINMGHCNITKKMIIVARPSKPFTFTSKHSPKRAVILAQYQQDIDALYGTPAQDPLYVGLGS
ncbi:hypothetical protein C8R46DRAFT_1251642 [Mycena filopes]|nr:hypothetical protein C8R46DRAFT_1251642 [Mycena filopes]